MIFTRKGAIAAGISAFSLAAGISAQAQEMNGNDRKTLEEIVVTATRRVENVQDVPVAVTAFSQESLDRLQVTDVFDLNRTVPNLIITETGGATTSPGILIRGIGLFDATWNAESGVGLYVDDVYVAGQLGTAFELIDVERIEVLRGPQGTLYGRNSTAGAVKIVVRRPDLDQVTFKADASYGSFDRLSARGSISLPVSRGKLAVKIDGVTRSEDGYVTNRTFGNKAGDVKRSVLRGAALWTPTDAFEAYLIANYAKDDSGISIATPARYDRATDVHVPIFGKNEGEVGIGVRDVNETEGTDVNLQLSYKTSDSGTFKSISAYRNVDSVLSGDLDGLAAGIPLPAAFGGGFLNIDFDQAYEDRIFTQEFQWLYKVTDNFDFVAGAYYFDRRTEQDTWTKLFFPTGMRQVADQKAKSYAGYVDATFDPSDRLQLFGGLRWTTEKKTVNHVGAIATEIGIATPFNPVPFPGATLFDFQGIDRRWSDLSHRFGAKYDISDDVMVYASRSRGFKPGQLVVARGPDPVGSGVFTDKETATTYEAGVKSKLFDRTVLFNATAFYQQYDDLQTGALDVNLVTQTYDVDIYGFEVEASWVTPLDGLQINAAAGLTKDKFDTVGLILKDTPERTGSIGFSYVTPISDGWSLGFNSNLYAQSKTYFANVAKNPSRAQDGYSTVDAQVYLKSNDDRWRVSVGGKNVFDKNFVLLGNDILGLPAVLEPVPYTQRYYDRGARWLLTITYNH